MTDPQVIVVDIICAKVIANVAVGRWERLRLAID